MTIEIVAAHLAKYEARTGKRPKFLILGELAWDHIAREISEKFLIAQNPEDECYWTAHDIAGGKRQLLGLDVVVTNGDAVEFGW